MNGFESDDLDTLTELLEDVDDESYEEATPLSRLRQFRRPAPRTATGNNLFQARPTQYVTQVQLDAAMKRVGAQIKTNSDAVRTLNSRVAADAAAIQKEAINRKQDLAKLRSNVQMTALLPLLIKPASVGPTSAEDKIGGIDVPQGTKVLVESKDKLSALLPLLLMGGLGGSDGKSSSGGDDQMMMLMMVMAISGGL